MVFPPKILSKKPELTNAFFKATMKGWEFAFNNIARTSELIYRKYNTQNKTLINIVKEGEILKELAYDSNGNIGTLKKDVLEDISPYPTLVGTAITGWLTKPPTTLGSAPSIPATTIRTFTVLKISNFETILLN